MVKRYVVTGDPMESPYGFWVEYGEVKGIAERCERLEGALQKIHDHGYTNSSDYEMVRDLLSGSRGGKDGF
jgi:hypothetical protein